MKPSSTYCLQFLPYSDDWHYSMSNCLVEASFQSAEANCSCVPGNLKISATQCEGPGLLCFRNVMNMIGKYNDGFRRSESL